MKELLISIVVGLMLGAVFIGASKVLGNDDLDPDWQTSHLQYRTEGTLPETWASGWSPATIPIADNRYNAHTLKVRPGIDVTDFTDGSIRVAYVSGAPSCVWEAPDRSTRYGGGRNLAQVGDEAWFKAGFGGHIYAVAGLSCEGFGIDVCTGIC